MPNPRFKKKDQQDNSTVTRPNSNKNKQYGRRPMHASYLLQRAMRSPQSLSEEDRFHLRTQIDPQKLQDILGGGSTPSSQNGIGQEQNNSSPDKSTSLANMTPFAGLTQQSSSTSESKSGGEGTIQRRNWFGRSSKKTTEEEETPVPQNTTTQDNDTDTTNDESDSLPEQLPTPTNVDINNEDSSGIDEGPLEYNGNEKVDVSRLLENYKRGEKERAESTSSNEEEQQDKPNIFKRMGQGIAGAWNSGVDYAKWLTTANNTGGRGERRTARYNIFYMGTSIINSIWSYITAALKASLVGIVGAVSYGISAILSTIHAIIAGFRAHRARKRFKMAKGYASAAQGRFAVPRGKQKNLLDHEESSKYDEAKQQLETWRKQHEKNIGEGGEGITAGGNSEDMKNMRFFAAMEYFKKKTKRKGIRSVVESAAYVASAAGGTAVGIGGLLAGAGILTLLASNPIGWGVALTLAFAGTMFLIGSAIYAGIRKWKKKSKGKISGRKREFFAGEVVNLAASGYTPAIRFLQDMGILRGGPFTNKGKFDQQDLNDVTKEADLRAMLARKFSSWY